jgi:hypothetical protein
MSFAKDARFRLITLMLSISLALLTLSSNLRAQNGSATKVGVDESTMIRLFFRPHSGDYLRPALLFRVVREDDPKWNTAPISPLGRSAYISLAEMNALADMMLQSHLAWRVSSTPTEIVPFIKLPLAREMKITIFTFSSTADGSVPPAKVCDVLARFNSAITVPRAHWEFQMYRRMYQCKVENVDPYAYPDHY